MAGRLSIQTLHKITFLLAGAPRIVAKLGVFNLPDLAVYFLVHLNEHNGVFSSELTLVHLNEHI